MVWFRMVRFGGGDRLGMNSKASGGKEAVPKVPSFLLGQPKVVEDGDFLPRNEVRVEILVEKIAVCGG